MTMRTYDPEENPSRTIGEMETGNGSIRVAIVSYHGNDYLDIRRFEVYGEPAEPRPTKKGVRLHLEMLPELLALLRKAEAA